MTASSSPNYRWRVGEVEITRVLEFEAALFEPAVIHPEASPEIIARHRTPVRRIRLGDLRRRDYVQILAVTRPRPLRNCSSP
jgi:hypothetical protein